METCHHSMRPFSIPQRGSDARREIRFPKRSLRCLMMMCRADCKRVPSPRSSSAFGEYRWERRAAREGEFISNESWSLARIRTR